MQPSSPAAYKRGLWKIGSNVFVECMRSSGVYGLTIHGMHKIQQSIRVIPYPKYESERIFQITLECSHPAWRHIREGCNK